MDIKGLAVALIKALISFEDVQVGVTIVTCTTTSKGSTDTLDWLPVMLE